MIDHNDHKFHRLESFIGLNGSVVEHPSLERLVPILTPGFCKPPLKESKALCIGQFTLVQEPISGQFTLVQEPISGQFTLVEEPISGVGLLPSCVDTLPVSDPNWQAQSQTTISIVMNWS